MIKPGTAIAIAVIFLDWFSSFPQEVAVAGKTTTRINCEPVGRVRSRGLINFDVGSLLCKGDRLRVVRGATVAIHCFSIEQVLPLTSNSDLSATSFCSQSVKKKTRRCAATRRNDCIKAKGPGEPNNTPALITPYGNTLIEGRPLLSWAPVPEANAYVIEVRNRTESWQQIVKNETKLLYPLEEQAMQPGHAYKITITAMQSDSIISDSETVVNLLSEKDANLIKAEVEEINELKLSEDEAAYLDFNSLYMSKNLLSETINTLEARVRAGSQSPALYRTLGDRYLEAGWPDYAKPQYEMATTLAKRISNSIELTLAQAGLRAAEVAILNDEQRSLVKPN